MAARMASVLWSDWTPCQVATCPCSNHRIPPCTPLQADAFNQDPTYQDLLKSNDAPNDVQETSLRDMIQALDSRQRALDNYLTRIAALRQTCQAQLEQMDTQIKCVIEERPKIVCAIRERKQAFNPVRRLPAEILSSIFHLCLDFPDAYHVIEEQDKRPKITQWWRFDTPSAMPWTLELVCKQWRAHALADPTLWSSLSVVISDENFASGKTRYVSRLARQLGRSQMAPLALCIRRDEGFDSDIVPPILPVLLLSSLHRVTELYLYLPHSLFDGLSLFRNHLQSLRSLQLLISPTDETVGDEPEHNTPITIFENCHNLRFIHTIDEWLPKDRYVLPWENITQYTSEHVFLDPTRYTYTPGPLPYQIRRLWKAAPNVQKCTIEIECSDGDVHSEVHSMSCQNLVDLTLNCYPGGICPIEDLFDMLKLPVLRSLKLLSDPKRGRVFDSPDVFSCTVDLVARSECPLEVFYFKDGNLLAEDVLRLLRVTPTLQVLRLEEVGSYEFPAITDDVVRELTVAPNSDAEILGPDLDVIAFNGHLQLGLDYLEMVKSRLPVTPLHFVELTFESPPDAVAGSTNAVADKLADRLSSLQEELDWVFNFQVNTRGDPASDLE